MPVIKLTRLNHLSSWGIWKVEETVSTLKSMLDGQPYDFRTFNQIHHEKKQKEWLAARILIRELLNFQQTPKYQVFTDERGKPFLAESYHQVSISHCYPYVLSAFHRHLSIGIDIERIQPKLIKVAPKFLDKRELDYAGRNLRILCSYWCAKESVYKMHGRHGITFKNHIRLDQLPNDHRGSFNSKLMLPAEEINVTIDFHYFQGHMICFTNRV